jgi:hypothetical protein
MFCIYSAKAARNFAGKLVFFTDELDNWMDQSPGLSLDEYFETEGN